MDLKISFTLPPIKASSTTPAPTTQPKKATNGTMTSIKSQNEVETKKVKKLNHFRQKQNHAKDQIRTTQRTTLKLQ
jgi:hypothetical protein